MFVSWYSRAYFIIPVDKMIHGTRVSSWRDVESCFIDGLACFTVTVTSHPSPSSFTTFTTKQTPSLRYESPVRARESTGLVSSRPSSSCIGMPESFYVLSTIVLWAHQAFILLDAVISTLQDHHPIDNNRGIS